jgi:hypothetical protein
MPIWSWIKRVQAAFSGRPGTTALPSEKIREIKLLANAMPDNGAAPELCFIGRTLVEVEEEWDDELNLPLRPNSIGLVNRVAIYEKHDQADSASFVAEQFRYNVGPVITPPGVQKEKLFVSLAQEFSSFDEAVDWILSSEMVSQVNVQESFTGQVESYRRKNQLPRS